MPNNAFDRTIINVRERPLSTDINQLQSQLDRVLRAQINKYFVGRASDSSDAFNTPTVARFFGDSFKVRAKNPVSGLVEVTPGLGYFPNSADVPTAIDSIVGLDDLELMKPLVLNAAQSFTVPTADPTNPRIDIIEVKYNRDTGNPLSRDILDPTTGAFVSSTVDKTLTFTLDGLTGSVVSPAGSTAAISYKKGVAAGSPTVPATTSGYVKIAEIRVAALATTFDDNVIGDFRRIAIPHNAFNFFVQYTTATAGSPPTLVRTNAPPGVKVCVVNDVSEPDIYLVAGDTASSIWSAAFGCNRALAKAVWSGFSDVTNITATTTEQSLLVGVTASPATKIAVGQPIVRIRTRLIIGLTPTGNPMTDLNDTLNAAGGPYSSVAVNALISGRYNF